MPRLGAMAQPGWYPDPSGTPGQLRYFDGNAWTTQVMPAAAPGTKQKGSGPSTGTIVAVVVGMLVLGLVIWLAVRPSGGRSFPEDTNSSSPTISAWDETSTPSSAPPTPSEEPTNTGGDPAACPPYVSDYALDQPRDGRYTGGGLSFPEIPGYQNSYGWGLDWASDRAGQRNSVTPTWVSIAVVGEIDRSDFPTPQSATNQLMQCLSSSTYFQNFSGRKDLQNEAITIDGRSGRKLVSEIRVAGRADGVQGDVVTLIVLDVGHEGKYAVFCGMAPIGDAERNQYVNSAMDGLQVRA